jgi:hypothetical protein
LQNDLPVWVLSHGEPRGFFPPGEERTALEYEAVWQQLQRAMAARSHRGLYRVVPGVGHLIASERPDLAAAAILEVVDATSRTRSQTQATQ